MKTVNHKFNVPIKYLVLLILLLCTFYSSGATETSKQKTDEFWSQYKIIVERNIFSRNRGRNTPVRGTPDDQGRIQQKAPQLESYFVLKGIAKENDKFAAFLEDTRDGHVIQVIANESIARGKITKLTLDSIIYQRDSEETPVKVGETLQGRPGGVALTLDNLLNWSEMESTALESQPADSTETPVGDDAEILKRLMERRRRELGE
jgi:hypothetical protein